MTDTKKLQLAFWIFIIGIIVFLLCVAFIEPLRVAVTLWLQGALGSTYVTLADFWAGIAAHPLYLQLHVLIWLVTGVILAFAIHQAHAANKIPLFKVRPPETAPAVMGPPQTIILREQATTIASPEKKEPEQEQKQEVTT